MLHGVTLHWLPDPPRLLLLPGGGEQPPSPWAAALEPPQPVVITARVVLAGQSQVERERFFPLFPSFYPKVLSFKAHQPNWSKIPVRPPPLPAMPGFSPSS